MNLPSLRLLGTLAVLATAAQAAPRPNIVHILVDDLGWQDIAAHKLDGKPIYETPHLDRMTQRGRRFTQAYSPAPTCGPSRVSFLRGQYPVNTGVYHVQGGRIPRAWRDDTAMVPPYYNYGLADEEPTVADVLLKAGYMTGHVGKWHAGGKSAGYPFPLDQGFAFGFSEKNGRQKFYNDPELWRAGDGNKNQFFGTWGKIKPDRITGFATEAEEDPYQLNQDGRPFDKPHDLAMGFIAKHKDKPFFLNYCPYYVHGPIQTRDKKRFEKYLKKMGYDFPTTAEDLNKGKKGHTNPYYGSMVDTLDWMVGEVITYLETTDDPRNPGHKLIDNTYVIVDSDNGGVLPYTDNAPLRGGKQNTYEGGVRIPFLITGPGVPQGSVCHTPISLVDLYPTFMEIAGAKPDPSLELDGCNILSHLHGSDAPVYDANGKMREAIFWHFPMDSQMSVAMRKGKWKLVHNFGVRGGGAATAKTELYQIFDETGAPADESEADDVSGKFPELCKAMKDELFDYLEETNATMPYRHVGGRNVDDSERTSVPKMLELSADGDQLKVTFEHGDGKAEVVEAALHYTLNPKPFDSTRGHREEWLTAPATLGHGEVTASMPPGATHAVFVMRDSNNFLLTSEPLPSYQIKSVTFKDSELVENGFAWHPGLVALAKLGTATLGDAKKLGLDTRELTSSLASAKALLAEKQIESEKYPDVIRSLRAAIRNAKGTPGSQLTVINRFPTDPLF